MKKESKTEFKKLFFASFVFIGLLFFYGSPGKALALTGYTGSGHTASGMNTDFCDKGQTYNSSPIFANSDDSYFLYYESTAYGESYPLGGWNYSSSAGTPGAEYESPWQGDYHTPNELGGVNNSIYTSGGTFTFTADCGGGGGGGGEISSSTAVMIGAIGGQAVAKVGEVVGGSIGKILLLLASLIGLGILGFYVGKLIWKSTDKQNSWFDKFNK